MNSGALWKFLYIVFVIFQIASFVTAGSLQGKKETDSQLNDDIDRLVRTVTNRDYTELHAVPPEEDVVPTATIEQNGLIQDSFTNKLINSLTTADNEMELKELGTVMGSRRTPQEDLHSKPEAKEWGGDEKPSIQSDFSDYDANSEQRHETHHHDETQNDDANAYQANFHSSKHLNHEIVNFSPSGSTTATDDFQLDLHHHPEFDNEAATLAEYRHYPNEYTSENEVGEKGMLETHVKPEKKESAYNIDTDFLKKELSAIREEDAKLDLEITSKYHAEKLTEENGIERKIDTNKESDNQEDLDSKSQNEAGSIEENSSRDVSENIVPTASSKQEEKREKNTASKQNPDDVDDDDLDKETNELLNINVSADGKIVQQDKIEKFSKESIFNKENLLPYLNLPKRNITTEMFIRNHTAADPDETDTLKADIAALKDDLKSSIITSNRIINEKMSSDNDEYNLRKKSLISIGRLINKTIPQALLLDSLSPVKRTEIIHYEPLIMSRTTNTAKPSESFRNFSWRGNSGRQEGDSSEFSHAFKKASFSQIHDRKTSSPNNPKKKSRFDRKQTELLENMYRKPSRRYSANKRVLHHRVSSKKEIRDENASKKTELVHNRKEYHIRKLHTHSNGKSLHHRRNTNACTNTSHHSHTSKKTSPHIRRQTITTPRGFSAAISYTDKEGHEVTFSVGTELLTYDNARRRCISRGGDLASITDEKEGEFVVNDLLSEPDNYWIGFDDQTKEGQFEWVDGSPFLYSNWSNLEPDDGTLGTANGHDEDCTIIKPTYDWSDVKCNSTYKFICKNSIEKTPHKPIYGDEIKKIDTQIHGTSTALTALNEPWLGPREPSNVQDKPTAALSALQSKSFNTSPTSEGSLNGGEGKTNIDPLTEVSNNLLAAKPFVTSAEAMSRPTSDLNTPIQNQQPNSNKYVELKEVRSGGNGGPSISGLSRSTESSHHYSFLNPEKPSLTQSIHTFPSQMRAVKEQKPIQKDGLLGSGQGTDFISTQGPALGNSGFSVDTGPPKFHEINQLVTPPGLSFPIIKEDTPSPSELTKLMSNPNFQKANELAQKMAPEIVKDYSVKFLPDISIVRQMCGRMCGETAGQLQFGDPTEIGLICGKSCAKSLLSMNPTEFMAVLGKLKDAESASAALQFQKSREIAAEAVKQILKPSFPSLSLLTPAPPTAPPTTPPNEDTNKQKPKEKEKNRQKEKDEEKPLPVNHVSLVYPGTYPLFPSETQLPSPINPFDVTHVMQGPEPDELTVMDNRIHPYQPYGRHHGKALKKRKKKKVHKKHKEIYPIEIDELEDHYETSDEGRGKEGNDNSESQPEVDDNMKGEDVVKQNKTFDRESSANAIQNAIKNVGTEHAEDTSKSNADLVDRYKAFAKDIAKYIKIKLSAKKHPTQENPEDDLSSFINHKLSEKTKDSAKKSSAVSEYSLADYKKKKLKWLDDKIHEYRDYLRHLASQSNTMVIDEDVLSQMKGQIEDDIKEVNDQGLSDIVSSAYKEKSNIYKRSEQDDSSEQNDKFKEEKERNENHYVNNWRKYSSKSHKKKKSSSSPPNYRIITVTGSKRGAVNPSSRGMISMAQSAVAPKVLEITIRSVGCFDPPFHGSNCDDTVGSIMVNQQELSQNKPGFNFVIHDFISGEMEQAVSFDTHGEAGAYEKLVKFLNGLDDWKIICIAVKDDAKNYLPDSAIQSFAKIGATDMVSNKIEFRSSYAFIGLSGPEEAREKMDWIREENSKAADGPSVIRVSVKTGLASYQNAGGKMTAMMKGIMKGASGSSNVAGGSLASSLSAAMVGGAAESGSVGGKSAGEKIAMATGDGKAGEISEKAGAKGSSEGVGSSEAKSGALSIEGGGGINGGASGIGGGMSSSGGASGVIGGSSAGGALGESGGALGGAGSAGGAIGGGGSAAGAAGGGSVGAEGGSGGTGGAMGGSIGGGGSAGGAAGLAGGNSVSGGGGGAVGGSGSSGGAAGLAGGSGSAGGGAGLAGGGSIGGSGGGTLGGGGSAGGLAAGVGGGGSADGATGLAGGGSVGGGGGGALGGSGSAGGAVGLAGEGGEGGGSVNGATGLAGGGSIGAGGSGSAIGGSVGVGGSAGGAAGLAGGGAIGGGGSAGAGLAGGGSGSVGGAAGLTGGGSIGGSESGAIGGGGSAGGLADGIGGGGSAGGASGLAGGGSIGGSEGGAIGGGGSAGGLAGGVGGGGLAGGATGLAGGGSFGGSGGGALGGGGSAGGLAGGVGGGGSAGGATGLAGGGSAGGSEGGALGGGESTGGLAGGVGGGSSASGAAGSVGGAIGGGGSAGGGSGLAGGIGGGGSVGGAAGLAGGGGDIGGGGLAGGAAGLAGGGSIGAEEGAGGTGGGIGGSIGGGGSVGGAAGLAGGGAVGGGTMGSSGASLSGGGGSKVGGGLIGGSSGGAIGGGMIGGSSLSGGSISGGGGMPSHLIGGGLKALGGRDLLNSVSKLLKENENSDTTQTVAKSNPGQKTIEYLLSQKSIKLLNSMKPSQLAKIIAPVDPVKGLLNAAQNLGLQKADTLDKKSISTNEVQEDKLNLLKLALARLNIPNYADLQRGFHDNLGKQTSEEKKSVKSSSLENVKQLNSQAQQNTQKTESMEAMKEKKAAAENAAAAKLGSAFGAATGVANSAKLLHSPTDPYVNMGMQVPGSLDAEGVTPAPVEPAAAPATDSNSSPMEAAADFTGSRNVGESRLASALSALGIPDAGATGIASLMASGFVSAGANNLKDATLKLGLAAKLSKSIADLGGRGAASAAGIASLNEILKDGREITVSRLADQIGQALQRVGGAGAAVGYAALASALKAVGNNRSPGAFVGGVILALAEQGAAPGTAGLAALAAGLGGSGADALAGGLGGSLPNVITASRTNNYMSSPPSASAPAEPGPSIVTGGGGGGETFHYVSGNIATQYPGQGPMGSEQNMKGPMISMEPPHLDPIAPVQPESPKPNLNAIDPAVLQNVLARIANNNHQTVESQDTSPQHQELQMSKNSIPQDQVTANNNLVNLGKLIAALLANKGNNVADVTPEVKAKDNLENSVNNKIEDNSETISGGELVTVENKSSDCQEANTYSKSCIATCNDKKTTIDRMLELSSSEQKASIKVNGEDWSKDEKGFNIVVLDYNTGEVESTESFDTEVDGGASSAMSNFIRSLPPGKILLGATKGDAGDLLIEDGYKALREAGAKSLARPLQKGDKYVFVGYSALNVPWAKEDLVDSRENIAKIDEPITVGPAASNDTCVCLQSCKSKEHGVLMRSSNAKSENAYADMGGMPVAAGSSGTKREIFSKLNLALLKKLQVADKSDDVSHGDNVFTDDNTDDDDDNDDGSAERKTGNKNPGLVVIPVANENAHRKKNGTQKSFSKKLNSVQHKHRQNKHHKQNESLEISTDFINVYRLAEDSEGRKKTLEGVHSKGGHESLTKHDKQGALSMVHHPDILKQVKMSGRKKHHGLKELPSSSQYDDIYSTIGNRLHSKKSEQPRPDE